MTVSSARQAAARPPMTLRPRPSLLAAPRIGLSAALVVTGTATALVFHLVMRFVFSRGYPYETFLYAPFNRFQDYYNMFRAAQHFHPGDSTVMVYSPLLHLFMTAFTHLPAVIGLAVVITAFMATVFAVLYFFAGRRVDDRRIRVLAALALSLASYPVLFALDRGNLEMVVFVLLAAFVYLYYERRSPWAWLPLALAIAAKYYWVTLLVIPLLDRRYRQALMAAAGAMVASLGAALILAPISGYGVVGMWHALGTTLNGHLRWSGSLLFVQHGHSLWGVVMLFNRAIGHQFESIPHFQQLYTLLALAVFVLVVVKLWQRPRSSWQVLAVLVACTLLLPFENADYVLVQWLLPFALFMGADRRVGADRCDARGLVLILLFVVPLVPMAYYYFPFIGQPDVGVSTLIYPAAVAAVGVLALLQGRDSSGLPEARRSGS